MSSDRADNRVLRAGPDDLRRFTDFVQGSPYGDVLQTPAWARLKATAGWKAHFILSESGGNVTAACMALEKPLPKLPYTILYCPRGPVLDWNNPEPLAALARELVKLARNRRAILVKVDPPVRDNVGAASDALASAGFIPVRSEGFGGTQPRCVMKLDLSAGVDAVFEGFKPKWRYNVRLAERKGVTVSQEGGSQIDAFYDILLETAKRDRFLVRSRDYFRTMWSELEKDGMIRLFLTRYEGAPVAGALMYVLGQQAWYTYGASSNEHRNVMPNHLMQWEMMRAAAEAGCTIYDFRGVSCNQEAVEDDHLQGLNRFKAGFGAEFVSYIGEFDLPVNRLMYFAWTRLAPAAMKLLKRRARQEAAD